MKPLTVLLIALLAAGNAFSEEGFWHDEVEKTKKNLRSAMASGDTSISFGTHGYFITTGGPWENVSEYPKIAAINEICTDDQRLCVNSERAYFSYQLDAIYKELKGINQRFEEAK